MGLPTARRVQGCDLKPPEKGHFEAAPGSLPLYETVTLLERAQRPWHVEGAVTLVLLAMGWKREKPASGRHSSW